jgi:hypothetical protein
MCIIIIANKRNPLSKLFERYNRLHAVLKTSNVFGISKRVWGGGEDEGSHGSQT